MTLMISFLRAKKFEELLMKVLSEDEPRESDLFKLFGSQYKFEMYLKGDEDYNQMLHIAEKLATKNGKGNTNNYIQQVNQWEERVIPQIKKKYEV